MDKRYYPVSYEEKYNATVYRLPLAVNEAVVRNAEDDGISVYINEDLTDEEARKAFEHAIGHEQNGDFEKVDVQQIEAAAHKEAPAEPEKKPKLKKRKKKRVFTQLDLDVLKADPWIAEFLGIPKDEIPKRAKNLMSKERFLELHHNVMEANQKIYGEEMQ